MKAYKVMERRPDGKLWSWNTRGAAAILYREDGRWVEARKSMAKLGYGLMVAESIRYARTYRLCKEDEVWEVEADRLYIPKGSSYGIDYLSTLRQVVRVIKERGLRMSFGREVRMCNRLRLVRRVK